MKKIKCFVFLLAAFIILTASSVTVFAASNETPADIVARLTGREVTEVIQEKLDTGKTYGTIAKEYGKLDEFKEECLKLKEQILKEEVKNGLLSQEEADNILAAIKANQAACNGTGSGNCWNRNPQSGNGSKWNKNYNNGWNRCNGYGRCLNRTQNKQNVSGIGRGNQCGRGQRACYNSCIYNN